MKLTLEENFIDNLSAPLARARWRNVNFDQIKGAGCRIAFLQAVSAFSGCSRLQGGSSTLETHGRNPEITMDTSVVEAVTPGLCVWNRRTLRNQHENFVAVDLLYGKAWLMREPLWETESSRFFFLFFPRIKVEVSFAEVSGAVGGYSSRFH